MLWCNMFKNLSGKLEVLCHILIEFVYIVRNHFNIVIVKHGKGVGLFSRLYEPTQNVVIEWNEHQHYDVDLKLRPKDVDRLNSIKQHLNCNIYIINGKDFLMKKTKTLFDHIKMITDIQDPEYWSKLSDADKKTWSNYMTHRFLSMNPDWVGLVNYAQTLDVQPHLLYTFYIGVIPKGRHWLKYVKGKKKSTYDSKLVELLSEYFELGLLDIYDYIPLMKKSEIEDILDLYGLEKKTKKQYMKGL